MGSMNLLDRRQCQQFQRWMKSHWRDYWVVWVELSRQWCHRGQGLYGVWVGLDWPSGIFLVNQGVCGLAKAVVGIPAGPKPISSASPTLSMGSNEDTHSAQTLMWNSHNSGNTLTCMSILKGQDFHKQTILSEGNLPLTGRMVWSRLQAAWSYSSGLEIESQQCSPVWLFGRLKNVLDKNSH